MVVDAREKFAQRFINHMKSTQATGQEVLRRLSVMPPEFVQMIKSASKSK